jgi:tetratricopeptide (TPR) repeat protein
MTSAPRSKVVCVLLFFITGALYLKVCRFGFVNYDDDLYVSANLHVNQGLSWDSVCWAFISVAASNWHPLTWLSHMADVEMFGIRPAAHHLTNVLLHTLNSVLLFLLLWRATWQLWPAAFVAALFAWHPLHVESVAWISERKDLLSGFFGLLSLLAYVRYAQPDVPGSNPASIPDSRRLYYAGALISFSLALMCKPMLVTLPCVMLLLDYWPLCRLNRHNPDGKAVRLRALVAEKIPFFVLAAASCVVTVYSQRQGGSVVSSEWISPLQRGENALVAYWMYFAKTFWPTRLAVLYPHPGSWPVLIVIAASAFMMAVTGAVLWQAKRRPYLAVGWFWFIGMLVPVIGLVQVGEQAYADRYTYLPLIGLFIAVAWQAKEVMAATPRVLVPATGALALAACIVCTNHQLQFWRNGETLFRRALAVTKNNCVAHNNYGNLLMDAHNVEGAEAHYAAALAIRPSYPDAELNLGRVLMEQGKLAEAISHFEFVATKRPDLVTAHYNLGAVLAELGKIEPAIASYQNAIAVDPEHVEAHYNLGILFARTGRHPDAEREYREAIRLKPGFALAHYNLGLALQVSGRLPEAREEFARAAQVDPSYIPAKEQLGLVLLGLEKFPEAVSIYQELVHLQPNDVASHNNLGMAFARSGKPEQAIPEFREVVRLDPANPTSHYSLGNAMNAAGHYADAAEQYTRVVELEPGHEAARRKLAALREKMARETR